MKQLYFSILLFSASFVQAQVGIGTATPNSSAQLDIVSTTQGVLFPRMTATQRAAIQNPAEGLFVFQTNGTKGLYYFDGSMWRNLATGYVPNSQGFANSVSGIGATTVFAGNGEATDVNGSLLSSSFSNLSGMAYNFGTFYVSNPSSSTIRTIYGNSVSHFNTAAYGIQQLAYTNGGLFGTANGIILKTDLSANPVSTTVFAGSSYAIDQLDGNGTNARFRAITSLAADNSGNLYVTDFNSGNTTSVIRVVSPSADVTTLQCVDANNNTVQFGSLQGIAVDALGNIYVSEIVRNRIWKITGGVATIVYGAGTQIASSMFSPSKLSVDTDGNLYVVDALRKIWKISPSGQAFLLVGSPEVVEPIQFNNIRSILALGNQLYIADAGNKMIYKVVTK